MEDELIGKKFGQGRYEIIDKCGFVHQFLIQISAVTLPVTYSCSDFKSEGLFFQPHQRFYRRLDEIGPGFNFP